MLLLLALAAGVSPVQKVIELLGDLKVKVQAELKHEEELVAEYTSWCAEESNAREDAISHAQRSIRELSATVEDSKASIQSLDSETSELATQISAVESELAKAKALREKEHGTFAKTEGELVETVDTLERAVVILKRAQTTHAASFLQKPDKDVSKLLPALSAIVQASWVDSRERAAVQNLIQQQQKDRDQDEDLSLQPQASVAAYEGHGSSIVEVLQDMQEKAEASLADARKTEMDGRHAFEMLSQTLNADLTQHQRRMEATTNSHTEIEEELYAASGELAQVKDGLAEDQKVLQETTSACGAKQKEWADRQKSAAEEMAVIAKAQEILQSAPGMSGLLQASRAADPVPEGDQRRRDKARDVLVALSQKFQLYSLSQVALSAESDPFEKVKGMIEGLIERLISEAGEEQDAKAFCDTETAKSAQKQDELTAKVDKYRVRVEKAVAAQQALKQQVTDLQREIAELDAAAATATKIRTSEHEEYEKAVAENKAAASAIADAMEVLNAYYSSGSFLQTAAAPELGGKKTDVASTILSILEVAEEDFTRLVAEGEAAEHQAAAAHAEFESETKVLRAAKVAESNGKSGELKSFELQELNYKEDYAATNKELDAVLKYIDELRPQCETKVQTFADRVARREAEIAGLKEALQILDGESI